MSDPTHDLPRSLGAMIRRQRELGEMSMRQLASMVGISNPYLSQIENGLRAPSEQVLRNIAVSLGVPVEDLADEASADDESAELMYDTIRADPLLNARQRRALIEVYDAMVIANRAERGSD